MQQKIIFMGTPDFAVESLKQIIQGNIEVAAVVTAPDRPAGRGQKLTASAVKNFALENNIPVLQPENLKDPEFIAELDKIDAQLYVVVAFRMLPEIVWAKPSLGTINLHGSLLPQYRGAAPINWAVINGDAKTGATTFFIEKQIDTGNIIDQVEIEIDKADNAGMVHDKLMVKGAELLVKTIHNIFDGKAIGKPQSELISGELKDAPKIFKKDCRIQWANSTAAIYNKIRGLSPYPAAWTEIIKDGKVKSLKLYDVIPHFDGLNHNRQIKIENHQLYFGTSDGWIEVLQMQLEGKKRMSVSDFLLGFDMKDVDLI
ncbi:methionyl-tRNA formyltransferase [Paracrocinitomix mangrovi]|uniref:methionyl-tRNA formyltransferase n=1 Tax=Paracrocinitomix mangrovi TaxID=2862509 RepID=UPI001EDC22A7|nr:methionyl-tRNA formyltransferase [Paracrocinitomix mangrovi]UKN02638.1 methionyl-tRNA formyltransferase [Paracrocinitomix mangrovi]